MHRLIETKHPAIALYAGTIMHKRMHEYAYRFCYRSFHLLLDVDCLDEVNKCSIIFSIDRFNLLSVYQKDVGFGSSDMSWRDWLELQLQPFGMSSSLAKARLLTMPRVLGYQFNPLSMWYCYDRDGQVFAIVAEVHNTFGERHSYVLTPTGAGDARRFECQQDKTFYVSPFIDMNASYHFSCEPPGAMLKTFIREYSEDKPFFIANHIARRRQCNTRSLLAVFCSIPLLTIKVIAAIHWQALKIYWRGAPIIKRQSKSVGG